MPRQPAKAAEIRMDTSMGAIKFWNGNVIAMGIEVHCDRIAALKAAPLAARMTRLYPYRGLAVHPLPP